MKLSKSLLLIAIFVSSLYSQPFSHQDHLRGAITKERKWWDLQYYHLQVTVNPQQKYISGTNLIRYKVISSHNELQLEMQEPMEILSVYQDDQKLDVRKDGYSHFIQLTKKQVVGAVNEVVVEYAGNPLVSKMPPWQGGITWTKDDNGNFFIASSCQGEGASIWWPNKDHPYDEVDSMRISVTVPEDLTDVSNGRLEKVDHNKQQKTKTFHWYVSNPINSYGVNINIGDYAHFSEKYNGEKGVLDCDYYVLSYNLDKAKKHFAEVPRMLKAFEHWFGPYPFYEDGYKLVEAPYLGMEHQSSVTYGNGYQNGYLGMDLSKSGWGLKFDFIIIHESGHEWFANSITSSDVADLWLHESFTNYSENLFLDYYYGKKASSDYVIGTRINIGNRKPIIGPYNVNKTGEDIYYKGANLLHTIRQLIDDDEKWREILRGLNRKFYHKIVSTQEIESYINENTKVNLRRIFDQYLRSTQIPNLEYYTRQNKLFYRWTNAVDKFDMPVKVSFGTEKQVWLYPSTSWRETRIPKSFKKLRIDRNFYVSTQNLLEEN
ncbi:M1 family metallopeptidase [Candidatus Uabimicrobium sp. HlEnr_7]|uniref:M1 family metallopeptidase n=1 Tax=Candidatus Uabimicrobium helgolandensis TaxID=3095367 RepID=UPI00355924DC